MTKLVSRTIVINKRRTSVRLENHMWSALKDIAEREKMTVHEVCNVIHMNVRGDTSFSASIRVFVMLYFKAASTEKGHSKAGHGSLRKLIGVDNRAPLEEGIYPYEDV